MKVAVGVIVALLALLFSLAVLLSAPLVALLFLFPLLGITGWAAFWGFVGVLAVWSLLLGLLRR